MRLINLVSGLFLGFSLTTVSVAAVVPSGSPTGSVSVGEVAVAKNTSKPKKSKKSRHAVSQGKAHRAVSHKASAPTAFADESLEDRSSDASYVLAPERVYSGLLPGQGQPVAYPVYANRQGRTECVELIKGLLGAPRTSLWKEGRKLRPHVDEIEPGTAIATFVNGRYPNANRRGHKHAAIFLRAGEGGIWVLDQFAHQSTAKERFIPWQHPRDRRASNNASSYSTVRW